MLFFFFTHFIFSPSLSKLNNSELGCDWISDLAALGVIIHHARHSQLLSAFLCARHGAHCFLTFFTLATSGALVYGCS